ncbi:MAG: hypothetical protein HY912_00675 [Desulfomonile tiedjei]|uniref:Uncharacterized protein n=1 Tax=Desulfomonile tiedjei TaxID=2358 RepID=A0A9D6Z492_9BACT|nr:hypothetical protein [Desulfomonile tiedjei]
MAPKLSALRRPHAWVRRLSLCDEVFIASFARCVDRYLATSGGPDYACCRILGNHMAGKRWTTRDRHVNIAPDDASGKGVRGAAGRMIVVSDSRDCVSILLYLHYYLPAFG